MASSYFELRKKQGNVMDSLREKVEKANGGGRRSSNDINIVDDTFWTPEHVRGKDGTGYAIIRFLPEAPNAECEGGVEPAPFVKYKEWYFQGPTGKKYYNLSPTSMGSDYKDPAQEYNYAVYRDESLTADEKKKKYLNSRDHYVFNLLVVKDPNRPDNEGKQFRFRAGYGTYKFIDEAMFPDKNLYPDREPIPVFDMVEGADFILRVITKEIPGRNGGKQSVPSYEKSEFKSPPPLFENEEDYEKTWKKMYTLQDYLKPERFKDYDVLLKEFINVMGVTPEGVKAMGGEGSSYSGTSEPSGSNRSYREPTSENSTLSRDIDDEIPDFGSSTKDVKADIDIDYSVFNTDTSDDDSPFKEDKGTSSSSDDDDLDWLNDLKK